MQYESDLVLEIRVLRQTGMPGGVACPPVRVRDWDGNDANIEALVCRPEMTRLQGDPPGGEGRVIEWAVLFFALEPIVSNIIKGQILNNLKWPHAPRAFYAVSVIS